MSWGEESGRLPRGTWDELPCEWGVEIGRQGRGKKIGPSLLIWGTWELILSPQRREGLIFAPPLSPNLHPPLTWELIPCPPWVISHSPPPSSSHVPPWVISRSPPPLTWELIPCPPWVTSRSPPPTHMGAHPMPLPLIGDMEAHPMSP